MKKNSATALGSAVLAGSVLVLGTAFFMLNETSAQAQATHSQGITTVTPTVPASPTPEVSYQQLAELSSQSSVNFDTIIPHQSFYTSHSQESRAAMSLVKLYIADYVLKNGTPEEENQVFDMIRTSDDGIASRLSNRYPDAISITAQNYGLTQTVQSEEGWGFSFTSTSDVNKFLLEILRTEPNSTILRAMNAYTEVAADGYNQKFGVALVDGMTGCKMGWTDDRASAHVSVCFGKGVVMSVHTNGTREQHNKDVNDAARNIASLLTEIPDQEEEPNLWLEFFREQLINIITEGRPKPLGY